MNLGPSWLSNYSPETSGLWLKHRGGLPLQSSPLPRREVPLGLGPLPYLRQGCREGWKVACVVLRLPLRSFWGPVMARDRDSSESPPASGRAGGQSPEPKAHPVFSPSPSRSRESSPRGRGRQRRTTRDPRAPVPMELLVSKPLRATPGTSGGGQRSPHPSPDDAQGQLLLPVTGPAG